MNELQISNQNSAILEDNQYNQLIRQAELFAASELVPAIYRNKPANCAIALLQAQKMNVDPFMLMQSLYIIHGKPGIESKMIVAIAKKSGAFESAITHKFAGEGNNRSCTAQATLKGGDRVEFTLSMKMANDEGWVGKPGSKWKTMPDLMLAYRSSSFLIKLYAPEALYGMQTKEELEEWAQSEKEVNPRQRQGLPEPEHKPQFVKEADLKKEPIQEPEPEVEPLVEAEEENPFGVDDLPQTKQYQGEPPKLTVDERYRELKRYPKEARDYVKSKMFLKYEDLEDDVARSKWIDEAVVHIMVFETNPK